MFRFICIVIFLILFLILTIPILIVEWIIGKFAPNARDISSLRIVQWGFKVILKITGVKTTVIGEENIPDEAVLFVGNHRSYFDILLTYSRCKRLTGYVAKKEMEKYLTLTTWMRRLYCLFLDRSDPKQGLKTILTAIDYIKRGISICIFPEGTRNTGAELSLLPFKDGAFKIATKTGCPIVPICMNNTAEIFENHFPKIRKTHVVIEYQKPIYPDRLDKETKRHIGDHVESIIKERKNGGPFSNLKDFIERLSGKEVNKRTIESFIKSGAFDSLGGTRKQFMVVYVQILDQVNRERKYSMTGQLSLFDIVSDDQKSEFDIPLPDVGEYEKETKLAFEKEVLGVYLSGHPLEDYEEKWRKNISRTTLDFQLDDETGRTKVHDGAKEIVGGMITNKTIKYTKTNKVMAFITLEDLVGSVEVVIFPRDFEKNQMYLNEEAKVFIKGRVSEEDDAPSKLICEQVIPFAQTRKELWLQYPDKETYLQQEGMLQDILKVSEGMDEVIIYCKKEKAVKRLPKGWNVTADEVLLSRLTNYLGESCVKVIEKPIESVH